MRVFFQHAIKRVAVLTEGRISRHGRGWGNYCMRTG
jgi:hypothetical protein